MFSASSTSAGSVVERLWNETKERNLTAKETNFPSNVFPKKDFLFYFIIMHENQFVYFLPAFLDINK